MRGSVCRHVYVCVRCMRVHACAHPHVFMCAGIQMADKQTRHVCMHVCMCLCARACVRACVCACVYVYAAGTGQARHVYLHACEQAVELPKLGFSIVHIFVKFAAEQGVVQAVFADRCVCVCALLLH